MEQPQNPRICLSCQNTFTGNFCNHCGEKVIGPEDRKLKMLLGEFVSTLFNIDNKFLKTIRLIFSKPGQLSENYATGKRKDFFKPSSLYILLTVIYFIFAPFQLFVPTLKTHSEFTSYANYAIRKIEKVCESKSLSMEELEPKYQAVAPRIAKWLILLYIPALGLFLWSLFFKHRAFVVDHFLLSIEINIYNIFAHFIILPLLIGLAVVFLKLLGIKINGISDTIIIPLIGLSLLRFFLLAFRRFYQQKWWITLVKSIVFIMALGSFAFTAYRFILFWIAMKMV